MDVQVDRSCIANLIDILRCDHKYGYSTNRSEIDGIAEVFDLCAHDGDKQLVSIFDQSPPSRDVVWHGSSDIATEKIHAEKLLGLLADGSGHTDQPDDLTPAGTRFSIIQRHP